MNPHVSVVILNWNSWEDTIECLESLIDINYDNFQIVLVDNGSTDNSWQKIQNYAQGNVEVIPKFGTFDTSNKPLKTAEYSATEVKKINSVGKSENNDIIMIKSDENRGFPGGNNLGIQYANQIGSDYILMLNNDTVVDEDFLTELVSVAENHPKAGILGSKIMDYEKDHLIQAAGGNIDWRLGGVEKTYGRMVEDHGQYNEVSKRDYVWGTSCLIKTELIRDIGLLDEYFFFGIEEFDYCDRAKKAGYDVLFVPRSKIWHKKGASSDNLDENPDSLMEYKKRAGFLQHKFYKRLNKKHHGNYFYILPFLLRFLWIGYNAVMKKLPINYSRHYNE